MASIVGSYGDQIQVGKIVILFKGKQVFAWEYNVRVNFKIVNAAGRGRYKIVVKEPLRFKLLRMLIGLLPVRKEVCDG